MSPRERSNRINRLLSAFEGNLSRARSAHAVAAITDDSTEPILVLHRTLLGLAIEFESVIEEVEKLAR